MEKITPADLEYCDQIIELTKIIKEFKSSAKSEDPAEISELMDKGIKLLIHVDSVK